MSVVGTIQDPPVVLNDRINWEVCGIERIERNDIFGIISIVPAGHRGFGEPNRPKPIPNGPYRERRPYSYIRSNLQWARISAQNIVCDHRTKRVPHDNTRSFIQPS